MNQWKLCEAALCLSVCKSLYFCPSVILSIRFFSYNMKDMRIGVLFLKNKTMVAETFGEATTTS